MYDLLEKKALRNLHLLRSAEVGGQDAVGRGAQGVMQASYSEEGVWNSYYFIES